MTAMRFELGPDRSSIDDKTLLDDLANVAGRICNGSPTVEQYREHGTYHPSTLIKRFGSWNDALVQAGLATTHYNAGIPKERAVSDLREVATRLGKQTLTQDEYANHGQFSAAPLLRVFGDWSTALKACGLKPSRRYRIPNEELFENIERMWRELGRQPKHREVVKPYSDFSAGTYERRFGSWRKALEAFVEHMNSPFPEVEEEGRERESPRQSPTPVPNRKSRTVNYRLRFLVLRRDGFRCCLCGATPAVTPGVRLHVDHVKAWSEGGETVLDNLQTCCERCNLGKSNLDLEPPGIQ
ncbi:homing endonuclease associated repeat-containing protein [Mucisphaera calidilacus]|uniref:HNH endonuclease n=1 Tax=Mucisphaera calidilacus TaxID=2527982 RepID=A0A518C169_9BACT|nr:HNH endonuclease [Mucisphaera calidilacus]QDU72960.1 HNH endonuclease [Mucisphaera calidilacus]